VLPCSILQCSLDICFVFVFEHSDCHDWSVSWYIAAPGWKGVAVVDSSFLEGRVVNDGDCTFIFVQMLPFYI